MPDGNRIIPFKSHEEEPKRERKHLTTIRLGRSVLKDLAKLSVINDTSIAQEVVAAVDERLDRTVAEGVLPERTEREYE